MPLFCRVNKKTHTHINKIPLIVSMAVKTLIENWRAQGFAYVGGACVVNKRLEKVNSVAIIEDTGGFSGIIVAAHEVGHLWVPSPWLFLPLADSLIARYYSLGAVHDGSPPPSYLGGPGAEKCRWEDGFIMSDLRHTEKGFRWSPCSISSFHHFLK
jgi:Metallo-peptidase family M12B Reprolysin-like